MICLRVDKEYITRQPREYLVESLLIRDLGFEIPESPLVIVEMPLAEVQDPLSWSLLTHECLHQCNLWEDLSAGLPPALLAAIPESKREEVLVDLLAVSYVGPVYAVMMNRYPRSIGRHASAQHPDAGTRQSYLGKFVEWYAKNESSEETELNVIVAERVLSELTANSVRGPDASIADAIQSYAKDLGTAIRSLFHQRGMRLWTERISSSLQASALAGIPVERLPDRLRELIVEGGILPCLPPIVLFNLVHIARQEQDEKMGDAEVARALMVAFRKWAVADAFMRSKNPI